MTRSTVFRSIFCLVIAFNFLMPPALLAQGLPPSTTLRYATGETGQIGATIENLGPGLSIGDLFAFGQGQLIQPINLARPTLSVEPLYDTQEFPDGPKRVTLTYPQVSLFADRTIIPGYVGAFLPARLGADITPEQFIGSYLADYILEVDGVQFMDSDLLKPENILKLGPLSAPVLPLPPGDFYLWGLNITMKFAPGTYRIRNIMRIPKTVAVPELGTTFLAGQLVYDITLRIVQPGSPEGAAVMTPEGPATMGTLPTIDEALTR
ncbi:MAG: hypothetical protein HY314_17110 [Acidobacteria bacterium]|nr:hypothetical protein [Acidobacteriota bacterium]